MDCRDNLYAFLREQVPRTLPYPLLPYSSRSSRTNGKSTSTVRMTPQIFVRRIFVSAREEPTRMALRDSTRKSVVDNSWPTVIFRLKQLENLLFDLWVGGLETTTGTVLHIRPTVIYRTFRKPWLGRSLPHSSPRGAEENARGDGYRSRQGWSHHDRPSI